MRIDRPRVNPRTRALLVTAAISLPLLVPLPAPVEKLGSGEWFDFRIDRITHFALFVPAAWAWAEAVGLAPGRSLRAAARIFLVGAAVAAWGGATELIQGWTGWREAEWGDFVGDVLGVVVGLAWALGRRRPRELATRERELLPP